jgi:hypothetical protein
MAPENRGIVEVARRVGRSEVEYCLITCTLSVDLREIRENLDSGEIRSQPIYGPELHFALDIARVLPNGRVAWEQFSNDPALLCREITETLSRMFCDIRVHPVEYGQGWVQVARCPSLWGQLESATPDGPRKGVRSHHEYAVAYSTENHGRARRHSYPMRRVSS